MKNNLTNLLPALALLALSSCAGTAALTSTESDGVYYSSKDRTTQNASTAKTDGYQSSAQGTGTAQGIDEDANPEYSTNNGAANSSNPEYYDGSYAARLNRFNQPSYRGLGLGYYDFAYTDPYYLGYGNGISPYGWGGGYYGSFDPFYSPYSAYGYGLGGSSLNLSLGLGFGNPFYRSFGYGYGYDPFYGGGLLGGYYGGRGYGYSNYGGTYYAGGTVDNGRSATMYAPRRDRTREATSVGQPTGGRINGTTSVGGVMADPSSSGAAATPGAGRSRGRIMDAAPSQPQQTGGYNLNERAMSDAETRAREGRMSGRLGNAATTSTPGSDATSIEQPRIDYGRRAQRMENNTNPSGATTAPQDYAQPQRRARFSDVFRSNPSAGDQSTPQRSYSPQPTRSFSEPRTSSPSFESPRSSGGSFGGSSSSGGGGGGGRGRVR